MGLDIFHAQAKLEVGEDFLRVDMASDEFKSLQAYAQVHENPHIDWEKMFSDRGLVFGNYRQLAVSRDGKYDCVAFVDANTVGLRAPIRFMFSNERQFPWLPKFMQRSKFSLPGSKKAPHFFGPFATIMKSENVIFYDTVGYQRNGVFDEFYDSFRPDDATCLEHRVEHIYQMTAPELREEFKRTFMDNWINDRSFVIISY